MSYQLSFSKQALKDISFHKQSGNKVIVKKLFILLNELTKHPLTGTGKPEQVKYNNLTGFWSHRIYKEHRLVY